MDWRQYLGTLIAGGLTLVLIVSCTILLAARVRVPTEFIDLIQVGFGATVMGGALAVRARR